MSHNSTKTQFILPVLVASQFAGTSLWFAGNAVLPAMQVELGFRNDALGHLTSAVQLGFIAGTLVFALSVIADRYSPSKVFFICAAAGAVVNASAVFLAYDLVNVIGFRFATGFLLAGIYPVGMKIAADWHEKGLGKALGFLVGALVLGTAFPHLLSDLMKELPWKYVYFFTSFIALVGGLLVLYLIPDGPYRKKSQRPQLSAAGRIFNNADFRAAAFGYFGHMWELYAFWAFIPLFLTAYLVRHNTTGFSVPLFSFLIIASGGLACVAGGYISMRMGSKKVAVAALAISGSCCLLSPLFFVLPAAAFMGLLLVWGMAVAADSPQFSTLAARSAPADLTGTALTIYNCIGFFITILSIQLLNFLAATIDHRYLFLLLAAGPLFGLFSVRRLRDGAAS